MSRSIAWDLFMQVPGFLCAGICDNYLGALIDHENGTEGNLIVMETDKPHDYYWKRLGRMSTPKEPVDLLAALQASLDRDRADIAARRNRTVFHEIQYKADSTELLYRGATPSD